VVGILFGGLAPGAAEVSAEVVQPSRCPGWLTAPLVSSDAGNSAGQAPAPGVETTAQRAGANGVYGKTPRDSYAAKFRLFLVNLSQLGRPSRWAP
jgi:hypothetical protein